MSQAPNCMSNTLDSVQIEPSCLDVGFGEVLHTWLLDGKNRASVVKRTPQCEGHLIPLGRSFAIGAIHVRGIQGAYLSCMTDSMDQPGHTRVKSSIGFN